MHTHTPSLSHTCPLPKSSKRRGFLTMCGVSWSPASSSTLMCIKSSHRPDSTPAHYHLSISISHTHTHTCSPQLRLSMRWILETHSLCPLLLSATQAVVMEMGYKRIVGKERDREKERELCVCVWVDRKTSSGYLMRVISLDAGKPNSFSAMRRTNHNIILQLSVSLCLSLFSPPHTE